MHFQTILLLLASITALVNADCYLRSETIERGYRLFTTDAKNDLTLLNTDEVKSGQTLYMVNPQNPAEVLTRKCTGRDFDKAIPMADQEPVVQQVTDAACPAPFKAYRVGYKLNTDQWNVPNMRKEQFLELYSSCYDAKAVQAKYIKHIVQNYKYRTGRPQNIEFKTDQLISSFAASTYKSMTIYDRFKVLFGNQQSYISNGRNVVINRGHMAPAADFMFINDKVITFRYLNVVPQFASINNGNWRLIENWVNDYAMGSGPLEVTTGATGVLALRNKQTNEMVPVYLGESRNGDLFNPVPQFMYKKVKPLRGTTYVMLTYNNIFEPEKGSDAFPGTCRKVACPIRLSNDRKEGITVCCDPNTFVP